MPKKKTSKTPKRSVAPPLVGIVMGSASDAPVMRACEDTLALCGVSFETRVLSAHRTPDETARYAKTASRRGLRVLICAAGGAAHLAGVVASQTLLPVLGVPMESASLKGLDSLLSTVQMPGGVPVASLSIGSAGAKNAALFAAEILALEYPAIRKKLLSLRRAQRKKTLGSSALR